MLVLSYAIGLMPFDPERVVALRGFESATFKRPVAIGDTIRVRCRVESTRPLDDDNALVRLALRVVNQHGRAVAVARVHAVCRAPDDPRSAEPGVAEARDADRGEAANDASGPWADDVLSVYGEEAYL
jgi:hypothetical protein